MDQPQDSPTPSPQNSQELPSQSPTQPPASPSHTAGGSDGHSRVRKPRKRISPLALVLLLSASFFVIFMIVSGALFLYRTPGREAPGSASSLFKSGAVGIVEVEGVILDSRKTLDALEDFEDDSDVKAVVLRLNSPGGAVAPSQEIYQAVKKYKKPVIASMASVAASGAYYIAVGAKKVYANPGTITGSIGVIMEFANLEKLYEWAKIRRFTIKTGKFKDVGSEYREMEPEDRELLQTMINDVLVQFKEAVSEGRKLTMDDVTKVADGRIFSGSQAKAAKLVDELGTLDDAVNEAGALGGIKGKPRVAYAKEKRPRLIDLLLQDGMGGDEDGSRFKGEGLIGRVLHQLTGEASRPVFLAPGIYWLWGGSR